MTPEITCLKFLFVILFLIVKVTSDSLYLSEEYLYYKRKFHLQTPHTESIPLDPLCCSSHFNKAITAASLAVCQ